MRVWRARKSATVPLVVDLDGTPIHCDLLWEALLLFIKSSFLQSWRLPLLVFWLGRLRILAFRGEVNEDPVLYVSKDATSLAVIAACLALAVVASLPVLT